MSVIFKRIAWKNFLSTGNDWTEIDLDSQRTTLIIGENGAGKSTILDALTYSLYNKPFRKINKPQLANSINKKHCVVEVEFDVGRDSYLVRRGMYPNLFDIEKNGELINQDASKRDYQEILERYILKLNYKSFCQVVILGSASFVPFMQLPTGQRREIIEDLLDIQIFTTMNMLLKDKMTNTQSDLLDVDYRIDLNKTKMSMHEENLKALVSNSQELIDDYEAKIARIERDIEAEVSIIEEKKTEQAVLISETSGFDKVSSKLDEVRSLKMKLTEKVERIDHDIHFFADHDNCPTCRQAIDDGFKKVTIEEKSKALAETREGITLIEQKHQELASKVLKMKELLDKISQINTDIGIRMAKLKELRSSKSESEAQIAKLRKKNDSYTADDEKTKQLEAELEVLADTKTELHETREIQKVVSAVLKDTGIKSKIIKQYIPVINKLINKYLASMDFFVQFELDENFNESIKSRFRDEFSYASFSEGEKAKIDLALLFAWRAVAKIRNSAATNLILLDEVFDGSLDSNSSDELIKILMEISNSSNIFIISHKTDALLDKFDRVIRFEKRQNYSMIAG